MGSARYPSSAWQSMRAPSLEDFETLAIGAWERLPSELKRLCRDTSLRVMDFPTDEMVDEQDLETPFDLLGLFEDTDYSAPVVINNTASRQSIFTVFRRPVLDYWCEHEEALGDVVVQIMLHEIGQHFGISEDDIEAFETRV